MPTITPSNFNKVLSLSIDETIREYLGVTVLNDLHKELKAKHDISSNEMPYRIETVYEILENSFQVKGAKTIGPLIAERFYKKLGIPYHNHEGYTLADYVERAKSFLASTK